ncbi:unnamed protein product [Prorocentrum cordatum]|uniref:Protein-tyrosine sulfotransferase n=1 Tax=Prorocentrum cordatum TaxID=2364126 RepID=A0ABN9Q2J3_9DINO|nr:unnamed protein product [Polarella glacialis]
MARAGRLVLLMLPGLAPLIASGLNIRGDRDGIGKGQPPDARERRVLLVVAGLSRHMEATWPLLEQSVIVPNERAGYTFTIFFSTNAGLECREGSPRWRYRKCEEPTVDRESHVKRIKEFFAPRVVSVVDFEDTCAERGAAEGMSVPWKVAGSKLFEAGHAASGGGMCTPWWDRVHRVVADMVESGQSFDRVVAMRPDAVVHHTGIRPPSGPVAMSLDEMCREKPGFSFVTPSWTAHRRMSLHNRDLDFMHILCPGKELAVYEKALRTPGDQCTARDPVTKRVMVPALPAEFHSTKLWDKNAFYCQFVQLWETKNISLSNWDSRFHLTWPAEFCIAEVEAQKNQCIGPGD